jgi:hypothetical protein
MSRGLHSDTKTALASGGYSPVVMMKLEFNTTYYLTNCSYSLSYDSNTYTTSAFLLDLSSIKEDTKLTISEIDITLSSVTTTILTDLFTYGHIGKPVTIYSGLIESPFGSTSLVDDPYQIFGGKTSGLSYTESAKESSMKLKASNHWSKLLEYNGRRITDQSQQNLFNGDLCFQLRDQVGKKITWGVGG